MAILGRGKRRIVLSAVLVIIGFNALVFQSLLLREFLSVFKDTELVLGIFLSFWLMWPAIGSWGAGRFFAHHKKNETLLAWSQTALFFLIPAIIFLVRSSRFFLGVAPGQEVGVTKMLYWVGLTSMPFGLIHGLQFTRAAALYAEAVNDATAGISRTYIFDTLGDVLGGAAFGYVLVAVLSSFQTAALAMSLIVISLLFIAIPGRITGRRLVGFGVLTVLGLSFAATAQRIDRFASTLGWSRSPIVATGSSKYGRYLVTKSGNLYSFFSDGGLVYSYPLKLPAEEIVHFTLTQTPNREQVLVIGLNPQIVTEALKYRIRRLYWVEIDPLAIALTKVIVNDSDRSAIGDPRVRVVNGDGRIFAARYRGPRFDAVIVNTGNPTTLTANRFYTREFFRAVKKIVNHTGVVFLKIASGENYLSQEKKDFNGSIYNALRESFPHIVAIPGEELYLVGCQTDSFLTAQPAVIGERLKRAGIKTEFVDERSLPFRLDPARIGWIANQLGSMPVVRTNRDDAPISSYYYLILWGSEFSHGLRGIFRLLSKVRFWWLVIGLLFAGAIGAAFRTNKKRFVPVAVFIIGLTGMALEIILILSFQTVYGYVYNLLGVVIAAFMAGILVGSLLVQRLFRKIKNPVRLLALVILAGGVYAGVVPLLVSVLRPVAVALGVGVITLLLFPALNCIAGFFVGVVFPLANHSYVTAGDRIGSVAGMLYGSDLAGGMVGGILTSLFLLPLFGLSETGIFLLILNSIVFVLLVTGRGK